MNNGHILEKQKGILISGVCILLRVWDQVIVFFIRLRDVA
jgi:hypothetical protein